MIDHEHKCIFIHIQRTAGTSIEKWICGADWWTIDQNTKHLLASQARTIYAEYWSDYFKFSFVRHPVHRVLSCLKYKDHFGIEIDENGDIDFSCYFALYGSDIVLEHDQRFYRRSELLRPVHSPNAVYSNIIDEELDFIGKFENLEHDVEFVRKILGIKTNFDQHVEKSESKPDPETLSKKTIDHIYEIYMKDMVNFCY